MSSPLSERIASLALSTFASLPQRCKPRINPDGKREWTPMSAVVMVTAGGDDVDILRCVSLATGTKCLPASAIKRCHGTILHDSHAEILAFRGLNYFLLAELQHILEDSSYHSPYLQRSSTTTTSKPSDTQEPPFKLRPSTSIYLFSTTAPCGDASMDLLISSKPALEAIPWSSSALAHDLEAGQPMGRGHFSLLGAVRRKPARADAEATMSKSCTDKIALKQFTSLLAFPVDLFVSRTREAFLKGMVVYGAEYDRIGYDRAFGREGRLSGIKDVAEGYYFDTTVLPDDFARFEFQKDQGTKATNLSALWIAGGEGRQDIQETLINGVKQGFKQFDDKAGKASVVCRKSMLEKAMEIQEILQRRGYEVRGRDFDCRHEPCTYSALKDCPQRRTRKETKQAFERELGGWISNAVEDDFVL